MKDTLLICGNGLDLFHGLPTKYSDFQKYCKVNQTKFYNDLTVLLKLSDELTSVDDLWSSLESSIGNISLDKLLRLANSHLKLADFKEVEQTTSGLKIIKKENSQIAQIHASALMRVLPNIKIELKKYLKTISLKDVFPKKMIESLLEMTVKIVTFNYTDTFEVVYRIPNEDILHIHGDVANNNEIIIVEKI